MSGQAILGISKYRQGSFILLEGDEGKDTFYIIRQGKVQVNRSVETLKENNSEVLGPGDFFGVISAMSRHPSTETAIALTDVILIAVKRDQFGFLIKQSAPLALKIIRYFSKKLRHFDVLLTQLSSKKHIHEESDVSQIYDIGEYYFKAGLIPLSIYAFQRYLDFLPNGPKSQEAIERIQRYARFKEEAFSSVSSGYTRKFKKDSFIFCEHEPGEELFIIQQGKVKITKLLGGREVLLAVLKGGDIFGEMAILENQPRSASAIAFDGDVTMLAVSRKNFSAMVTEQPQLATRLITILSERIWSIYRQINNILLEDPEARTLDTLLTIVLRDRVPIKRNERYLFEFGIKELVNMMGLPYAEGKEKVVMALKDRLFKVEGENRIICNDLEELQKRVQAQLKKIEILRKSKKM